ncbi:MAG: hypothetical protein WCO56_19225 [Verrucomicrobiota bacterium]
MEWFLMINFFLNRRVVLVATILVALSGLIGQGRAGTFVAVQSASWHLPTTWSPVGPPGTNDTAINNGQILTLSDPVTIAALELAGGRITGGALTLTEGGHWTGGDLLTPLLVYANATLWLEGPTTLVLGATLTNLGTIYSTNQMILQFNSGVRLMNLGRFELAGRGTFQCPSAATKPRFFNLGTFRKGPEPDTVLFAATDGVEFHNSGRVEALGGVLRWNGGSFHTNATFVASPGARLEWNKNGHRISGQCRFDGGGRFVLADAVTFDAAQCRVTNGVLACEGSGAQLLGEAEVLATGSGASWEWSAGRVAGTLTLGDGLTVRMTGDTEKTLSGGTLTNRGMLTWSGSGDFAGYSGARFVNLGQMEVQNDARIYCPFGGDGVPIFINAGTFRKNGGSGSTLLANLNGGWQWLNRGVLEVTSGLVQLDCPATLESGTRIAGPGLLRISSLAVTNLGRCVLTNQGWLELSNGVWHGTGSVAGTGTFGWCSGSLGGRQLFEAGCQFFIRSGAAKNLEAGTRLELAGTTWWTNAADITVGSGATITNRGWLEVSGSGSWYATGAAASFVNNGRWHKSGTGTLAFTSAGAVGWMLVNNGLWEVEQGNLDASQAQVMFGPDSQLHFRWGGTNYPADYGHLTLGDGVILGGNLQVSFKNGWLPPAGTGFDTMVFGSSTGRFGTVTLAGGSACDWRVRQEPTRLRVETLPGTRVRPVSRLGEQGWQLRLDGPAGTRVAVEASTDLTGWTVVCTNETFAGALEFMDSQSAACGKRFYRVKVREP